MSLPPGFLDELRSRTSLARVVGRKVVWDQRKSNQGKGDLWAPCPFHQEKTASFHVDDKQGFYYCFGCHAKGDAIAFVRETENVGFMEAIEILAREAGMTMPAADPWAREVSDRRTRLAEVMEQAVQFYRLQLRTAAAAAAREYLQRRGLGQAALERFEIGFAPDSRTAATEALKAKGVTPDLIVEAGLAAEPDGGGAPYDRFRGRIMFPIRDARGRCIAFGGRAMDPNARAKYLNSPETPLFDKGRSLYNHAPAREAAGKGQPLVVAEGYMDVIALSEAGFGAAVAPLGTAVTADQLALMWRIADEPVIALDGDTAGLRAAMRVIDLALPLLEAGKGLRFALLPDGLDPDDLIRQRGADAMRGVIEGALPMVQLLWRRETEGRVFDSPERKAALDRDLRERLKTIRDASIRQHYGEEIRRLRLDLFRPQAPARGGWRTPRPAPVLESTRRSVLAAVEIGHEDVLREALILAVLLARPEALAEVEAALERVEFSDAHAPIAASILRHAHAPGPLRAAVSADVGADTIEKLYAQAHIRIERALRPDASDEVVSVCLNEALAKLRAGRSASEEALHAAEEIAGVADESLTWRLAQAAEARNRAARAEVEDKAEYEIAPNGLRLERSHLEEAQKLFESINFGKGRPQRD